jgi:hypothetical protein
MICLFIVNIQNWKERHPKEYVGKMFNSNPLEGNANL